ncbi:hypothetical protein KSC_000730 [Ktedonobacter sp. SOSP1-52]|nr:hypothetical protein KSC_000730 [Ktedonobacter sp. SOSP1-52]
MHKTLLDRKAATGSQWWESARRLGEGRIPLDVSGGVSNVVVEIPEPTVQRNDTVVGVDLGLNRPAVTSHRQFLGSRHWKEVDRRRFRLRRKLQSKGSRVCQTASQKDVAEADAFPPGL